MSPFQGIASSADFELCASYFSSRVSDYWYRSVAYQIPLSPVLCISVPKGGTHTGSRSAHATHLHVVNTPNLDEPKKKHLSLRPRLPKSEPPILWSFRGRRDAIRLFVIYLLLDLDQTPLSGICVKIIMICTRRSESCGSTRKNTF